MRILLRVIAAAVVVLAVGVVALALLLPRVLASDAVREQVQTAADGALGREVRYAELDFGLFPPALLALDVAVAGESPEAPPLIEAESVALRAALLPLLLRTLVIDSFVVQGAKAHLVRTGDGIQLPRRASARARPPGAGEPAPAGEGESAAVDVALARFELRDGAVVLEDRSVAPPVIWEARDVHLRARGTSPGEPVAFDLSLALASGGRIAAAGTATLDREVDVELTLDAVAVAPARAYLEPGSELAGALSGSVVARGPVAAPASLRIDVALDEGRFRIDDMTLRGHVDIEADVRGGLASPRGSFDIDATDAEVLYGGTFAKPPGNAATVTGKIVTESDGSPGFDDVHLKIRNFEADASVRTGKRLRVVANAPPFDLDGWEELIPALAGYDLSGPARVEDLALMTSPLDVRGAVHLEGVTGVLPGGGPVRIEGTLVGAGDVVNSENLRIVAADQLVDVRGTASDLDRDVRYRVRLEARDADTNRLVSTFTSKRDFVYGLLTLDGDLSGTVAGERPPFESVDGSVRIDIAKGRLRGVSLLQLTFDRFGALGPVAQLASQVLGGPALQRFYGDDFREIRGTLDVGGGVVRTDDLRMVYRDYRVDLRGTLRLRDLAIDMTGRITVGERIRDALGKSGASASANEIPLARVTGSLDDPKVRVTPEVAAAFLTRAGAGVAVDEALGEVLGDEVGDLLEGILGGSRRRR